VETIKALFAPESGLLRWLGYLLVLAGLVYCGLALRALGLETLAQSLPPGAWIAALLAGLVYGGMLCLLAFGWWGMVHENEGCDPVVALAIYGPAVLAKYAPGSVFQYGSRQLNGALYGLSHKAMAKASLVEAGLHIPAALVSAAALYSGGGIFGLGILVAAGLALAGFAKPDWARAAGFQLAFFALFALAALLLCSVALPIADPGHASAMFLLAWVAGFLVPVAPGGIGVRETVLLALATPTEGTAAIAAFAILTRLATTTGDAVMGLAGYGVLLSRRSNRQASS
jgi:hypothetical protein